MTVPNIAFVGGAGAGKTTAAATLVSRFPELGYETISFATPVKVGLGTSTDRHRLQEFGTDIVRRYDDRFWLRLFEWHLDLRTQIRQAHVLVGAGSVGAAMDAPVRWCNDDCRFENELAFLQDSGWKIIEVTAPLQVRIDRLTRNGKLTDPAQLSHSSERSLGRLVPDWVLVNDAGPEYLTMGLVQALESFR